MNLFCVNSNPMFVRPLSAVGSAPAAAAAVWRQWYWRSTSPFITTRNPFASPRPFCPFPWTELPSTDNRRHLHLSAGLMKHPDSEPPVKRRRSLECERTDEDVQHSSKRSASRERRESVPPAWLHDVPDVLRPPRESSPSLVKSGDDAAQRLL